MFDPLNKPCLEEELPVIMMVNSNAYGAKWSDYVEN